MANREKNLTKDSDGTKMIASATSAPFAQRIQAETPQAFPAYKEPVGNFPLQLLTVEHVQQILSVGRTFVSERVTSGDLRPIKFGTSRRAAIRFFAHDVYAYLAKLAESRDSEDQERA